MAKWGIFKCQLCGKRFKEKFERKWDGKAYQEIDVEHIGRYTHTISTHKCTDGKYGCGALIGAEIGH